MLTRSMGSRACEINQSGSTVRHKTLSRFLISKLEYYCERQACRPKRIKSRLTGRLFLRERTHEKTTKCSRLRKISESASLASIRKICVGFCKFKCEEDECFLRRAWSKSTHTTANLHVSWIWGLTPKFGRKLDERAQNLFPQTLMRILNYCLNIEILNLVYWNWEFSWLVLQFGWHLLIETIFWYENLFCPSTVAEPARMVFDYEFFFWTHQKNPIKNCSGMIIGIYSVQQWLREEFFWYKIAMIMRIINPWFT